MAKQSKRKRNGNQTACYKRYQAENRHYKNKVRKLTKYVKDNPNDTAASERLIKIVEVGTIPYTRSRKARKPNETEQRRVKLIRGYSTTQNTFFKPIKQKVSSIFNKKVT